MKRIVIDPRHDWQNKVRKLGFEYFNDSADGIYWREDAYYEFTTSETDAIYDATRELFKLCEKAVDYIVENDDLWHYVNIAPSLAEEIKKSWYRNDPTLYGRYDFTIGKDGNYKMLEFNADTPTSVFEASIVQWFWKEEVFGDSRDQYNSIQETMESQFEYIQTRLPLGTRLYFTSVTEPVEDLITTLYLKSVAERAGLPTGYIKIDDIGYADGQFLDMNDRPMNALFKLYPWEWLVEEDFGEHAFDSMKTWIEPVWKMLLSNKAILPILWKLFPNHPNLLPAYFSDEYVEGTLQYYVKKPILAREGNNVTVNSEDGEYTSEGVYGSETMIIQETCVVPKFGDNYAVIGSWIVGAEPCGVGIREDSTVVTKNTSKFVPHVIKG